MIITNNKNKIKIIKKQNKANKHNKANNQNKANKQTNKQTNKKKTQANKIKKTNIVYTIHTQRTYSVVNFFVIIKPHLRNAIQVSVDGLQCAVGKLVGVIVTINVANTRAWNEFKRALGDGFGMLEHELAR